MDIGILWDAFDAHWWWRGHVHSFMSFDILVSLWYGCWDIWFSRWVLARCRPAVHWTLRPWASRAPPACPVSSAGTSWTKRGAWRPTASTWLKTTSWPRPLESSKILCISLYIYGRIRDRHWFPTRERERRWEREMKEWEEKGKRR